MIVNYLVVDGRLSSGGQPSEAQLRALARDGVEVVINLGLADAPYALPNESTLMNELGVVYHHLPVEFSAPTQADLRRFIELMRRHRGANTFVHCAANKRVSCFLAVWGELELGWARAEADAHIRKVWEPDPVWAGFLEEARATLLAPETARSVTD